MTPITSVDETNAIQGAIPGPRIWTFVHAAVLASLLVATVISVVFSVMFMANGDHRGDFRLWNLRILFAMLVVWSSAIVFYLVFRAAGLLWTLKRRISDARSKPPGRSVIWDDWLDGPETYHR
jgi:protein-S-isoprenylcysteine O-methyltransferase Ste14